MKNKKLFKTCLPLVLFSFCAVYFLNWENDGIRMDNAAILHQIKEPENENLIDENDKEYEGESEYEHDKFIVTKMTQQELQQMWDEINIMQGENSVVVNQWKSLGPAGSFVSGGNYTYWSGRMLDIKIGSGAKSWFASASGGLWESTSPFVYPIADTLTTLVIGSVDTQPGNDNVILVGTGEPSRRNGTGLWKTTNGGGTWTNIAISPNAGNFFKVRFFPLDNALVYAAADNGFYKSTNSGTTWTRIFNGRVSDFAMSSISIYTVYIGVWSSPSAVGGIYKTTDGGNNWAYILGGYNPNIGRTAVALCDGVPSTIYTTVAREDDQNFYFMYKSTDNGNNWINLTPNVDPDLINIFRYQGDYDNVIGVCPSNQQIVLFGGVGLYRTINGGNTWVDLRLTDYNVHADIHSIRWGSNSNVWVGSDGGLAYSNNLGQSFSSSSNYFPITQFVYVDVSKLNHNYIMGGTQDNGVLGTSNRGQSWTALIGGDGGGTAFSTSTNGLVMSSTTAPGGSPINFRRNYSTDWGVNFSTANTGIDPDVNSYWYPAVRAGGSYFYTAHFNFIYRYVGGTWTKVNAAAFPNAVYDFDVTPGGSLIYASLYGTTSGQRLRVYDGGTWYERSAGISAGIGIRRITTHPANDNIAYAVVLHNTTGEKVYKTLDKGISWTNISGNMPNVPCTDIVPHPANNNLLYLSTEAGCYRSTNAGVNWQKWSNGMPQSAIVTELKTIDSLSINSKYYVVAATYGRSIWTREVSGDDPVGISQNNQPVLFSLSQNYPNPFNPVTRIKYSLPDNMNINITVYDVSGKEVSVLVNEFKYAGNYEASFDAANFASGVYFYKIKAGDFADVKKMTLLK